jgi:hypothetical protein
LSVQEKIDKELSYVVDALHLDANEAKHWAYKLKREYEKEEKIRKRIE